MDEVLPYAKVEQSLILFEAEDHHLKSGKVGLYSNGTSGAYFDLIQIQPIQCLKMVDKPH